MKTRTLVVALVLAIGVSLLPVYPVGQLEPADPTSTIDSRVRATISGSQLNEILQLVRQPRWGGLWATTLRAGKALPVIDVTDLEQDESANGGVAVRTGEIRGPRNGSGYRYVVERRGKAWFLLHRGRWFS